MELLISVSADGFSKGDRIVAKVGRGEWLQGVVQTSGKNLKLAFDDKTSATVGPEDFKDVKQIAPRTKKNKDTMTAADAKALISAFKAGQKAVKPVTKVAKVAAPGKVVKTPKTSKVDPLKPVKAKKQDGDAQDHANQSAKRAVQKVVEKKARVGDIAAKTALPAANQPYPQTGFVFSLGSTKISRPTDEFIATEIKRGRSLIDVKMTKIKGGVEGKLNLYHWKVRIGGWGSIPYTYLRKASQAELDHADGKRQVLVDKKQALVDKNHEQRLVLGIQPGDKVMVNYSNGSKEELVTDINYSTGKAAIWSYRDVRGKKRRFIHIKFISAVTQKGPGKFTPPTGYFY